VAGYTDIVVAESTWLPDAWLLKLDAAGSLVWDKTYGGPGVDVAWSVQESPNHTYVVGGYSDSFGAGGLDAWAVNVKEGGEIADCALIGETTAIEAVTDTAGAPVSARSSTSSPGRCCLASRAMRTCSQPPTGTATAGLMESTFS
jgi:hypothetical protein